MARLVPHDFPGFVGKDRIDDDDGEVEHTQPYPDGYVEDRLRDMLMLKARVQNDLTIHDVHLDDGLARMQNLDITVRVIAVYESPVENKLIISPATNSGYELYYDANNDDAILFNHSPRDLVVSSVSEVRGTPQQPILLHKGDTMTLSTGCWRFSICEPDLSNLRDMMELLIRPRQHSILVHSAEPETPAKRSSQPEKFSLASKKIKAQVVDTKDTWRAIPLPSASTAPMPPVPSSANAAISKSPQNPSSTALPLQKAELMNKNLALSKLQGGQAMTVRNHDASFAAQHVGLLNCYSLKPVAGRHKRGVHVDVFSAYLVEGQENPGHIVVVKAFKIPSTEMGDRERREAAIQASRQWWQEYHVHRQLRHDRICSLVGADARIWTLYIQKYMMFSLAHRSWRCGPGLEHNARAGFFRGDLDDARRVLADIASALRYLKEQGFKHNDIKPDNILYNREDPENPGRSSGAILIDFGVATPAATSPKGGTPWYLPPESLVSSRGETADIWALGVVLLYLMGCIPLPSQLAAGGMGVGGWRTWPPLVQNPGSERSTSCGFGSTS
ncbi:hypothetical protein PG984_012113 [Apiospora sp. TS-2023a]